MTNLIWVGQLGFLLDLIMLLWKVELLDEEKNTNNIKKTNESDKTKKLAVMYPRFLQYCTHKKAEKQVHKLHDLYNFHI